MINKIDMDIINDLLDSLDKIALGTNNGYISVLPLYAKEIEVKLTRISVNVQDDFPRHSEYISFLNTKLFMNNGMINIVPLSQVISALWFLKISIEDAINNNQWNYIHEKFQNDVRGKFLYGFYSDSVLTATHILMERLKNINNKVDPQCPDIDGANLVDKLFSANNPQILFCRIDTKTGENTQKGYADFFRGWILAIRNKKAHSLTEQISEIEAFRELVFISMLMTALDKRVSPPIFDDE